MRSSKISSWMCRRRYICIHVTTHKSHTINIIWPLGWLGIGNWWWQDSQLLAWSSVHPVHLLLFDWRWQETQVKRLDRYNTHRCLKSKLLFCPFFASLCIFRSYVHVPYLSDELAGKKDWSVVNKTLATTTDPWPEQWVHAKSVVLQQLLEEGWSLWN